jgi:hypothetical protein
VISIREHVIEEFSSRFRTDDVTHFEDSAPSGIRFIGITEFFFKQFLHHKKVLLVRRSAYTAPGVWCLPDADAFIPEYGQKRHLLPWPWNLGDRVWVLCHARRLGYVAIKVDRDDPANMSEVFIFSARTTEQTSRREFSQWVCSDPTLVSHTWGPFNPYIAFLEPRHLLPSEPAQLPAVS